MIVCKNRKGDRAFTWLGENHNTIPCAQQDGYAYILDTGPELMDRDSTGLSVIDTDIPRLLKPDGLNGAKRANGTGEVYLMRVKSRSHGWPDES